MARLGKSVLLGRIIGALERGGRSVLIEDASHPFILRVEEDGRYFRARVYIWNITHGGGRARARDEYRIQITGVDRFSAAAVDRAVVLGWWEEGGVFAAWDISRHLSRLGASPSMQVVEGVLRTASLSGVATQEKSNSEIVVSFVPSFLGDYIVHAPDLHAFAGSSSDLGALNQVVTDPASSDTAIEAATPGPRQIVLAQVARKLRSTSFSERVLRAYGNACSMCGVQLRLIDAAHILPVSTHNNDDTSNGIALCALHHRAYDRALLSMDDQYRVVLNPDRLAVLQAEHLTQGFAGFKKNLRALLSLPPAPRDRPEPALIRQANRARGWKRFQRVA